MSETKAPPKYESKAVPYMKTKGEVLRLAQAQLKMQKYTKIKPKKMVQGYILDLV